MGMYWSRSLAFHSLVKKSTRIPALPPYRARLGAKDFRVFSCAGPGRCLANMVSLKQSED